MFNRSVAKVQIFRSPQDYQRCVDVLDYYRISDPPRSFSDYNKMTPMGKKIFRYKLTTRLKIVSVLAFALMPNHFHLLLRPLQENSVSTYLRIFQNGYAKYFNTKYKRTGSLFQSMFKLVRIESDDQLMHVARYIHLNPLTGYLIQEPYELDEYPWISWSAYMKSTAETFVDTEMVSDLYPDVGALRDFTLDQTDYQRTLARNKHLLHDFET